MAKPTIGYITNFGKAHLEGFGGYEGVVKGKSELYDYLMENGQQILVNDNDPIQKEKTKHYSSKISFGTADSDYQFEPIYKDHFVGVKYQETKIFFPILQGITITYNISAAVALGLYFDVPIEDIKKALSENYFPSNMRSQNPEKRGKNKNAGFLDTYNANPSSMLVSLENF